MTSQTSSSESGPILSEQHDEVRRAHGASLSIPIAAMPDPRTPPAGVPIALGTRDPIGMNADRTGCTTATRPRGRELGSNRTESTEHSTGLARVARPRIRRTAVARCQIRGEYLKAYESITETRASLAQFSDCANPEKPHQALE